MSKEQEEKLALQWMYENADALGQWSTQITNELTKTGSFYSQEDLRTALEDSVPCLTPERTGIQHFPPAPQGRYAQAVIIDAMAAAVTGNSLSREFTTEKGVETRYTTDALLEAEQTIFKEAVAMTCSETGGQPYGNKEDVRDVLNSLGQVIYEASDHAYDLNPAHLDILNDLLKPGNLRIVNGPPGSGKSTLAQGLLFAMAKEAFDAGEIPPPFYASAPSAKAAASIVSDMNEMKSAAAKAGLDGLADEIPEVQGTPSLDVMIGALKEGRIKKGAFVVVDEAGLMGSKQMADLLSGARNSGVRLFLFGDNLQIPPKTAGNGFDQLMMNRDELLLDTCDLLAVLRQKTAGEAQWTLDIRGEGVSLALDGYAARRYTGYKEGADGRMEICFKDGGNEGDAGIRMAQDSAAVYGALTADFIRFKKIQDTFAKPKTFVVMGTDEQSAADMNAYMREEMKRAGMITEAKVYESRGKSLEIGRGDTILITKEIVAGQDECGQEISISAGAQLVVKGEKDGVFNVADGRLSYALDAAAVVENGCHGLALPLYQAQGQSKDRAFLAVDKTGWMDKVYGGVAFSRHQEQMSAYVSEKAYPDLGALADEMAVFRTRQPLLSDGKGVRFVDEKAKRTEEKVSEFFKALYKSKKRSFESGRAVSSQAAHEPGAGEKQAGAGVHPAVLNRLVHRGKGN